MADLTVSLDIDAIMQAANYAAVKTLLSLDNVQNTALSTWTGTTNITTLGTVSTGTWNATVVSSAYGGTGVNNSTRTLTINTNAGTIAFPGSSTVMTFPATTATIARTDASQTFTGTQTVTRIDAGISGTAGNLYLLNSSPAIRMVVGFNGTSNPGLYGGANTIHSWTSGNDPTGTSIDLAVSRSAAGVLEINNGTGGTQRDLLLRNIGIGGTAIASTTFVNLPAGTTAKSPMNFASGVAPTSPVNGDLWFDGTDFKIRVGGVTKTITAV